MNPQGVTLWNRLPIIAILIATVLCTAFATEAKAACFTAAKNPLAAPKLQLGASGAALSALDERSTLGGLDSIVGLWNSEFLIGDGPDRYDQSFQQFHSDGTEMMLSNGLPPVLGNVCVGVWKQAGPRMVKLRHVAWNWDTDGHFAGTFVMLVTLRLDRRGNSFSGTWTADSLDVAGNVIPELHAEGVARGTRISVD